MTSRIVVGGDGALWAAGDGRSASECRLLILQVTERPVTDGIFCLAQRYTKFERKRASRREVTEGRVSQTPTHSARAQGRIQRSILGRPSLGGGGLTNLPPFSRFSTHGFRPLYFEIADFFVKFLSLFSHFFWGGTGHFRPLDSHGPVPPPPLDPSMHVPRFVALAGTGGCRCRSNTKFIEW